MTTQHETQEEWKAAQKEHWVAYWRGAPRENWETAQKDTLWRIRDRNNFLMDLENWILHKWDSRQGIPQGPRRFENEAWATLVKTGLQDSDTSWEEYSAWCLAGYGDEWFQEE